MKLFIAAFHSWHSLSTSSCAFAAHYLRIPGCLQCTDTHVDSGPEHRLLETLAATSEHGTLIRMPFSMMTRKSQCISVVSSICVLANAVISSPTQQPLGGTGVRWPDSIGSENYNRTGQNDTLCDAGSSQWTGFVRVGKDRDMFYCESSRERFGKGTQSIQGISKAVMIQKMRLWLYG